jgi:diguanylate cyclase (GGDEF)-like protein/PAS domain S-box-containing protein/putative nucleotidyltransferase with HDIG domain
MRRLRGLPWLRVLLFGAGYLVLAILGGSLAMRYDAPVYWPAAGLSLGVLLRSPREHWPGYLGAIVVIDLVLYLSAGANPLLAGVLAASDVLEPAIAALVLLRMAGAAAARIDAPSSALLFLIVAPGAAALGASLLGGTAITLDQGGSLREHWAEYWACDGLGMLTVAPLVLVARADALSGRTWRSRLELALALVLAGKIAYTIFSPEHHRPYTYLLFVVPTLIALRTGILGAAAAAIVTTPIILVLTGEGGGPYGLLPLESALHQVQFFAAVLAGVLLLVGATADALRRTGLDAALRLREAVDVRRRFERIATSIDEGVFTYRRLPNQWVLDYASPAWGEIFGLEITPTAGDLLEEYIHPDDIDDARAGWDRVDAGEWVAQEYRVTTPQGQLRWVNERLRLRVDETGEWIDGIVSDITERRSEEQRREKIAARLRVMSRTDGLTGLANRRHLTTELERCLGACREGGPGLALLLLDLDRFMVVNDSFGHEAGDAVLRQTAERIAEATSDAAAVAGRWGGEEFCVLVPGLDAEGGLRTVAETLRTAISEVPMRLDDGSELTVTATIGGTVQRRGTAARGPDLVGRADRALYAGKRRGRDRVLLDSDLRAGDATSADSDLLHTAQALALAVSIREGVPALHCQQVADLSARTAERLGLPAAAVLRARLGGWLHDVGKIAIPDGILGKPGALDEAEWEVMRAHPVVGAEVVRRVPGLDLAAAAVEQHHERWDGTGYPGGRSGEAIALEARIVACADAYSAITSDRVYRPERSRGEGIDELRRSAGTHLDPAVVEALVAVLESDEADFVQRLGLAS